ncbi:MAG: DUF1698 domain-containing protein [Pseudoxanthomonas sp.]
MAYINKSLPWYAATALPDGRVVGSLNARRGKREVLEPIPDKRITRLDEAVGLEGKRVLELGCFEGIHTIGLCSCGADVTAVDLRVQNVIKTHARLSVYGVSADVFVLDVEDPAVRLPRFDVVFHCGVLYHLEEPVQHLRRLLPLCDAIYLDTHIAREEESSAVLESGGRTYHGRHFIEGGWADPFSGRGAGAFWLRLSDIEAILAEEGFACDVWGVREERNGPRVGLFGLRR